jgi:hypothetical protein
MLVEAFRLKDHGEMRFNDANIMRIMFGTKGIYRRLVRSSEDWVRKCRQPSSHASRAEMPAGGGFLPQSLSLGRRPVGKALAATWPLTARNVDTSLSAENSWGVFAK